MSVLLFKPRYIALDSSHLGQWARDRASMDMADRRAAAAFESWLELNGFLVLLCLHHIEELVNHESDVVVRARLRLIAGRKLIAWIGAPHDKGPGSIVTVFAEEVRAVLDGGAGVTAANVRERAKVRLIQAGSGADLLGPEPEGWLLLRPAFSDHAGTAREVVALARTNLVDISDMPMSELMRGSVRQGDELRRQLDLLSGSFAVDIARRGDRRIKSPQAVASEFVRQVEAMAKPAENSASELVLRALALQGVTGSDIQPDSTVGEMLDLGLFRAQLRVAAEAAGIPFHIAVGAVRQEQVPTWQIAKALERNSPDVPERKGSELTDTYLACLSAYADVVCVDKRVREAFRRLTRKEAGVAGLLGRVERAASYRELPRILAED